MESLVNEPYDGTTGGEGAGVMKGQGWKYGGAINRHLI